MTKSALQIARAAYQPKLETLKGSVKAAKAHTTGSRSGSYPETVPEHLRNAVD